MVNSDNATTASVDKSEQRRFEKCLRLRRSVDPEDKKPADRMNAAMMQILRVRSLGCCVWQQETGTVWSLELSLAVGCYEGGEGAGRGEREGRRRSSIPHCLSTLSCFVSSLLLLIVLNWILSAVFIYRREHLGERQRWS